MFINSLKSNILFVRLFNRYLVVFKLQIPSNVHLNMPNGIKVLLWSWHGISLKLSLPIHKLVVPACPPFCPIAKYILLSIYHDKWCILFCQSLYQSNLQQHLGPWMNQRHVLVLFVKLSEYGVSLANSIQISWPLSDTKFFILKTKLSLYRLEAIGGSCFFFSKNCESNIKFPILFHDHNLGGTSWLANNICITYLMINKPTTTTWVSYFGVNSSNFAKINWRFSFVPKKSSTPSTTLATSFQITCLRCSSSHFPPCNSCVFTCFCLNYPGKQRWCLGHTMNWDQTIEVHRLI